MDKQSNSANINFIISKLQTRFNFYNNVAISCCFKKSKILSYGISKPDIHIHSIKNNKQFSIHAEVDAINNYYAKYKNKIRKKIGKFDIITIRLNSGKLVSAMPCKFCIETLNKIQNINKMYFTNNSTIYVQPFINIYNNKNIYGYSSGDRRVNKY